MKLLLMITIAIMPLIASAQEIKLLRSESEVIKKRLKATLKVSIFKKGKKIKEGAAFAYGDKGHLITNFHNFYIEDESGKRKELFNQKDYEIQFRTHSGLNLKNVELVKCSDDRNVDICLLKSGELVNGPYFPMIDKNFSVGTRGVVIGHCHLRPWKIKSGTVVKVWKDIEKKYNVAGRTDGGSIETIEGSFKPCPGDSGGPFLSSNKGNIIGMVTEGIKNHELTISSKELFNYYIKFQDNEVNAISNLKRVNKKSGKEEIRDMLGI